MSPALSILMPTYNGAQYLREQVDSILAQRFGDFELVTIDDGSTDDTRNLLDEYARRDSRVRVLAAEGNRGQVVRLGELLDASEAPLLAMSDQDDVWHLDKLSLLIDGLGDAGLAFGPSALIDGAGQSLGRTLLHTAPPLPANDHRLIYLFKPVVSAHAMVVRRRHLSPMAFRRGHWFDQLIGLDSVFSAGVRFIREAVTLHRMHDANQCNGDAADDRPLMERAAKALPARQARMQLGERWHLIQRFEHLAFSECIDPDRRTLFHRLMNACIGAWLSSDDANMISNADLRQRLVEGLVPLQGSAADWAYARYQIENLTRSVLHPRLVYRTWRSVAFG